MVNTLFSSYKIEERSYVSFVKREIHNLVNPVFDEKRTGEIDIVVAELTSNLIKYAGQGELLYRLRTENDDPFFELICIDNGPGISNISHYTKDGNSSTASLGHGIGSVLRLSNLAQFYSMENWGTIVYCNFRLSLDYIEPKKKLQIRTIMLAKPGEIVSGDNIAVKNIGSKTCILTCDGLGHGAGAKEAADAAVKSFKESESTDASELLKQMDKNVKRTRGLVASIGIFDHEEKKWEICGVGNIATRLYQGLDYRNYICHNGIIGLNIPARMDNANINVERFQQLILCSDGIKTKWELIKYTGILKYDPMILAAALYKDLARKTDDMTILIAKVQ